MTSVSRSDLAGLSAKGLASRLFSLRALEREALVEFLQYLGELDGRRLYVEQGYASTFAFCTGQLGLTKAPAFRRTVAARLLVRFPFIAEYLADGRLGLTTLATLRAVLHPVLSDDACRRLLDRAAGRTEAEVKLLVASLEPRPAPPDLSPSNLSPPPSSPPPSSAREAAVGFRPEPPEPLRLPSPVAGTAPISADSLILQMAVGADFVTDLATVREALSQQIPDGELEKVLHECVRRTLAELVPRRVAVAPAARTARRAKSTGGHLSSVLRKEVWRRDRGSCAFTPADGNRCGSTYLVKPFHVQTLADGGTALAANVSLRCAPHRAYPYGVDLVWPGGDYGRAGSQGVGAGRPA